MKTLFLMLAMVAMCPVPAWAVFGIKIPDVLGSSVSCEVCQKELSSFEKNDKRLVEAKRCTQHRDFVKRCESCSNAWIPIMKTDCEECCRQRRAREERQAREARQREAARQKEEEARQRQTCVVCQKEFPSFEMQNYRCGNHRDLVNKCTICSNVWLRIFYTECEACVEKRELAEKQAEETKRRETKRRESARQDELRRDTPFRVAFANGSVFAKGSAEFEAVFEALSSHWLPYVLRKSDFDHGETRQSLRADEGDLERLNKRLRRDTNCKMICVFQNALSTEDSSVTNIYPVIIGVSRGSIEVFYACAKPASSLAEESLANMRYDVSVIGLMIDDRERRLLQDLRPNAIDLAIKYSEDKPLTEPIGAQVRSLCSRYLNEEKLAEDNLRRKKVSEAYLEVQERLKSQAAETAPFSSAIDFAAEFFKVAERGDGNKFPTMFLRVAVNDNAASRGEVAMGMPEFYKTIRRKKLFPAEDKAKFVFYVDPSDYHVKQKDPGSAIVHVFVKVGDLYDYCGDLCLSKWKKEWKVRDWRPNDEFTDILDHL